ncbi:MAG: poly(R)-hydroxyalkanoic acid synthase subunit PhaE [Bacteroidota bacterium]|nr:poly(R)-hydroxyalkanoic acid synthase subunit PhaE [Bacteroidota bacterium]
MENKNMFESFADMQKKATETFTTAAETMQKAMMNGKVDFNSDFFKKWYDSQMDWFNQTQGENKNNQALSFFTNWMNSQMEMAKNWQDMSQGMFKGMPQMNNMTNDYSNMMNMFNSWKESMSGTYSEMMKNFNNGTAKESFGGLFNNAEMYMKMFEMMMPMMKSLNDNTYTPEMFKSMFNTEMYKNMMDKMFNMQPDFMKNMNDQMKNGMFNMMDMNKGMFDNMKANMNGQMASMMPTDMFGTMFNNYQNMYSQMNNAFAPLTKLMPVNDQSKMMDSMKEISNMLTTYNMKNSQLQYMMYATGLKAMDELSETLYSKMRNGDDMKAFANVYQEWLSIHDKHMVALFETDEYSKLMAEVSSLQLTMKKKIEKEMEKSMSHLPVINRTEMDELYQTVYELKKRINMLEKQLDTETVVAEEPKAAAKKTAKNA